MADHRPRGIIGIGEHLKRSPEWGFDGRGYAVIAG